MRTTGLKIAVLMLLSQQPMDKLWLQMHSLGICDANEVFFKCAAVQEFGKHREITHARIPKTFTEREAALRTEHQKLEEK